MNSLIKTVVVAAATTTASLAFARWLGARNASPAAHPRPVELWENEGGALKPAAAVESSPNAPDEPRLGV